MKSKNAGLGPGRACRNRQAPDLQREALEEERIVVQHELCGSGIFIHIARELYGQCLRGRFRGDGQRVDDALLRQRIIAPEELLRRVVGVVLGGTLAIGSDRAERGRIEGALDFLRLEVSPGEVDRQRSRTDDRNECDRAKNGEVAVPVAHQPSQMQAERRGPHSLPSQQPHRNT